MKLFKFLGISLIAAASLFTVSCGMTQPTPEEVMEKVSNNEKLEVEDYQTILDYLDEFCEMGEMTDNDYESGKLVAEEYPYFMPFAMSLDNAPQEIKEDEYYIEVKNRFTNLMNR